MRLKKIFVLCQAVCCGALLAFIPEASATPPLLADQKRHPAVWLTIPRIPAVGYKSQISKHSWDVPRCSVNYGLQLPTSSSSEGALATPQLPSKL